MQYISSVSVCYHNVSCTQVIVPLTASILAATLSQYLGQGLVETQISVNMLTIYTSWTTWTQASHTRLSVTRNSRKLWNVLSRPGQCKSRQESTPHFQVAQSSCSVTLSLSGHHAAETFWSTTNQAWTYLDDLLDMRVIIPVSQKLKSAFSGLTETRSVNFRGHASRVNIYDMRSLLSGDVFITS